ncbi:MAG TPA: hypothetical protein VF494_12310 [Candidatus Limnocylindrales bacterium]
MSRATLWRVLAVGLPIVAAIAAPLPSVDLTFLLRAGSEILASGAIPTTDSWTFTAAGSPWLDQQWAAEVLLQVVFGAAGWTGLVLFRAALVGLAFGLLLATIRRRAPRLGPIAVALLVVSAFVVSANALALRAQLLAIVLFAATLYVLAIRVERPRAVWLIPLFALLWANLHGTFLFAPALCGLAWLADLYEAGPSRLRGWTLHRMFLVGLVATAATLVNPFGPAVWGYVANLTSNPTIASRVSEWLPPSPLGVPGALVWLSVLGVAALALTRIRAAWRARDTGDTSDTSDTSGSIRRRRGAFRSRVNIPWPALLTLGLFGGFALASGRGTAWWPFAAAFVIAPWLQPDAPPAAVAPGAGAAPGAADVPPSRRPTPPPLRRLNLAIVGALVVAGGALLPTWRPLGPLGVPTGTLTQAPQGIAQFHDRTTCEQAGPGSPRVWNPQVWGSWLEFAAPCALYAVDSRIELFSAQVWDDGATVEAGGPGWEAIVDRAQVAEVIVEYADNEAFERAAHDAQAVWSRVLADCDGSIWVRIGPPGYRGFIRPDAPVPTCD